MRAVIVSGLSGAGKSAAARALEDMGYFCVDNLPPPLIRDFLALARGGGRRFEKVAFVIDIRGGDFLDDFVGYLKGGGMGVGAAGELRLVFLEASKLALLRRFSETRRQHPLASGKTNGEAIDEEIARLGPIKAMCDLIIDTSDLKTNEMVGILREFLGGDGRGRPFRFLVQSFGYKYGMPQEADFVFDVRFVANPFYEEGLRDLTGLDPAVAEFVLRDGEARFFADEVLMALSRLKPSFLREGKASLNVAFGCTGGQHRSVAMAEEMAGRLRGLGEDVAVRHREI